MAPISWKVLSVAEFISRYREVSEQSTAKTDQSTLLSDIVWQKQTVRTFFSTYQWAPSQIEYKVEEPFSLRLSVKSFFQCFDWDASIHLTTAPSSKETQDESEDISSINLQNFSDLF